MAFGIKHMVILAGAGVLFAYGSALSGRERSDVIARNNLVDGQPEAYDSCISALHRKKLTHGGSKKDFCACFAKQATEYLKPEHKNLAGKFLEKTLDKRDVAMGADVFVPASYEGLAVAPQQVALSVLMATNQCSEDVRTTCPQSDQSCIDRLKSKVRHAQK